MKHLSDFQVFTENIILESSEIKRIKLVGSGTRLFFRLEEKSVTIDIHHANSGWVRWMTIDQNGKSTHHTSATDAWVIKILEKAFENSRDRESTSDVILSNPIFLKWWNAARYQNRGKLAADKFGFNEAFGTTMTAREIADYIKSLTPSDSDHPDYFISLILKSKKKFHLKTVKIEDLLKNDESLREYVESGEVRYGEDGESDLEPHPDEILNPIVVFDGEVVDGYSRTSTLYHSGEKTIQAWVSE